jgi:hypothetical protein
VKRYTPGAVATFYLISTATVAAQGGVKKLFPGSMIDDAQVDVAAIARSGSLLVPSGNAAVAAAAGRVATLRLAQGINEVVAEAIMRSAVTSSPSGGGQVQVPFDHTNAAPLILQTVNPGDILFHAAIAVVQPFNGPGASVRLGTSADPALVFDTSQVDLGNQNTFDSAHTLLFFQNDVFQLAFSLAGSSQGSAMLIYELVD